ncbi:hypothetical protein BDR07DRAFT_1486456 [Suillus spraguei]|nr:hypothetical protein BDR07DRAFT_1486456 [Suillus spraguei]
MSGSTFVRREVKSSKKENAKPYTKAPKIQRLVTPIRLQRRRHLRSLNRRRIDRQKEQKAEYDALMQKRVAEKKAKVAAIKASHTRLPKIIPTHRFTLHVMLLMVPMSRHALTLYYLH